MKFSAVRVAQRYLAASTISEPAVSDTGWEESYGIWVRELKVDIQLVYPNSFRVPGLSPYQDRKGIKLYVSQKERGPNKGMWTLSWSENGRGVEYRGDSKVRALLAGDEKIKEVLNKARETHQGNIRTVAWGLENLNQKIRTQIKEGDIQEALENSDLSKYQYLETRDLAPGLFDPLIKEHQSLIQKARDMSVEVSLQIQVDLAVKSVQDALSRANSARDGRQNMDANRSVYHWLEKLKKLDPKVYEETKGYVEKNLNPWYGE